MIIGKPVPKSNLYLLKELILWQRECILLSAECRVRKCSCLFVYQWLTLNHAWLWLTLASQDIKLPRWVTLNECIWDFSSFTEVRYQQCPSSYIRSFLPYFVTLLTDKSTVLGDAVAHQLVMAHPPFAHQNPSTTARDNHLPYRVLCPHFESKGVNLWNKEMLPNHCYLLALATEFLHGCGVWVVAPALSQDENTAGSPGGPMNCIGWYWWKPQRG